MRRKKSAVPIVGIIIITVVIVGVIALSVFLGMMLRNTSQKKEILLTLQASVQACQDRDLDAFEETINPELAYNIDKWLECAKVANEKIENGVNTLIDVLKQLFPDEYTKLINRYGITIDRKNIFDIALIIGASELENIHFDRISPHDIESFTIQKDDAEIVLYCTAEVYGKEQSNYLRFKLHHDRHARKWYITGCSDSLGWLDGFRWLLSLNADADFGT